MKIPASPRKQAVKTAVILLSTTLLYILYRYEGSSRFFITFLGRADDFSLVQARSVYYQCAAAFFLLGVIPMCIVRIGFREKLGEYGVFFKKPFVSLFITVAGIAFITPFVYFGARRPELNSLYPLVQNSGDSPVNFLKSALFYLLYYIGYEFCFRGFLFMGIREDVGDIQAIMVSLLATVLLHVTQPQSETLMAVLAGIVFPLIVRRLKTLWPGIFIHAYTGIALDYWIIMGRGGF